MRLIYSCSKFNCFISSAIHPISIEVDARCRLCFSDHGAFHGPVYRSRNCLRVSEHVLFISLVYFSFTTKGVKNPLQCRQI